MASRVSENEILRTMMNGIRKRMISQKVGIPMTTLRPALLLMRRTAGSTSQDHGTSRVPGKVNRFFPGDPVVGVPGDVGEGDANGLAGSRLHEVDGHVAHVGDLLDRAAYHVLTEAGIRLVH